MRYNSDYKHEGDYSHYTVEEPMPLLEWLLKNVGQTRSKIKATLQGRGIKVNGKTVSQFDFALKPGMKVSVSNTKRNQRGFKSRWLKIVYEDKWLIVVEKEAGILSMAAGHSSLNVKSVRCWSTTGTRSSTTAAMWPSARVRWSRTKAPSPTG